MEIAKTLTARGRGRWGHDTYDVELISCTQSWWDATGSRRESRTSFELACSMPVGSRFFSTEAERDVFIEASFSDLALDPVEPPKVWHEPPTLYDVVGERPTGIEFVEDYFRLSWPDDYLDVYGDAAIIERERRWDSGSPGFSEKLQSLVDRRLTGVDEILDRGLVLAFEGPVELEVNLSQAAEGVADAALHSSADEWTRGSLWPVGKPPFDE